MLPKFRETATVLSGKLSNEPLPDVVSVEYFDGGNCILYNVENEHSSRGRERHIAMSRSIASRRFRLYVEHRAEIISATATVNDALESYGWKLLIVEVAYLCHKALDSAMK